MARRLGAEVVQHWTLGPEQFGKKREPVLKDTYQGCWVEFDSTDEGTSSQQNVATILAGLWIPKDLTVDDADDFFIWTRYPDEKYRAGGKVGRYYNRRGQLRAAYVPVGDKS